jgi:hypothetical protein
MSANHENRGTMPVSRLGVALSIVLLVVLGIVSAYTLGFLGPSPDANFEMTQETLTYCSYAGDECRGTPVNLTTLTVTHLGGSTLDGRQISVTVEGNRSVYGSVPASRTSRLSHYPAMFPVPDAVTATSSESMDITAADSWAIHSYSGGDRYAGLSHERFVALYVTDSGESCPVMHFDTGPNRALFHHAPCFTLSANQSLEPLTGGEDVTVEWTAESGRRSATLFSGQVE